MNKKKIKKYEEIIEFYVIAIMEGKMTLDVVKDIYKADVEKELYKTLYNECFEDSQY